MTNTEKGLIGEKIAEEFLTKHGIEFSRGGYGSGADIILKGSTRIDVKYSNKGKDNKWRFNLHNHGVCQSVDFFILILNLGNAEHDILVYKQTAPPRKTFVIPESWLERERIVEMRENWAALIMSTIFSNQLPHGVIACDEYLEIIENEQREGDNLKKIINGVTYDTANAKPIASAKTKEWEATLYRTPYSGRFFLHGNGTFMSIFRGKEKIIPNTDKEAFFWIKKYAQAEKIGEHCDLVQTYFGKEI